MIRKILLFVMLVGIGIFNVNAQSTWFPQTSGVESALYSVDFINQNNGIAVGDAGTIIRTTDGGENWQIINSGVTDVLNSVSYIDENNIIIVGNGGLILKSIDAGQTWAQKNVSGMTYDLLGLDMLPSGKGIAGGRAQTILWTNDGGENWTILRTDYWGGGFYAAHILNDNLAFVYGENSIMTHLIGKVMNGGDSLDFRDFYINYNGAMTEGIINDGYNFNEDSCVTVGAIFPGIAAITSNQSWEERYWNSSYILDAYYLQGVDFIGPYGVAVGANYGRGTSLIVESTDFGQNWTEIPENYSKKASANRNVKLIENTGYIVGDGGKILKKTPEVGIPENSNKLGITISPNPAVTGATISFNNPANSNVSLNLYNATGQMAAKVYNGTLTAGMQKISLPVQNLNNGLYFITIYCEGHSYTQKIVIAQN